MARSLTIALPLLAGCAVAVAAICFGWTFNLSTAGFVMAAGALVITGVLAAFGQLASWRTELGARDRADEAPLRAMVDEAATHMLLAILESVLVTVLALIAVGLSRWDRWALLATIPMACLTGHVLYLFTLVVPRLYSAYVQINDIDESLDGYSRTKD